MTAETFELMANVQPEAMLLVTASGGVVAVNHAMGQILDGHFPGGCVQNVSEVFHNPPEQIRAYLRLCSGMGQFAPCGLKLNDVFATASDLTCEGAAICDPKPSERQIILRLKKHAVAAARFRWLNEQIERLNQEIARRIKVENLNRWMAGIVESSEDAIISKDLNGVIISCNQGASHLFGYAVEELIGQPMTILIPAGHQGEEAEILGRIRLGKSIKHFETIRRRKDGGLIEVSLTISPVKDADGNIVGASKIARDITGRKLTEQKLEESFQREKAAREIAETANRAKDDFLASLSHELRTPLNPVLMIASDAADNLELPPEVRAHFEVVRKNIELEARLIDDLLDLTRISHGKLSLHSSVIEVSAPLSEAIANVRSDLNEKQIQLTLNCEKTRMPVCGDAVRLQQVFWNVLKNAVKFTPPKGKILIETTSAKDRVIVSITDTGIGMTPEETARIFESFSQGDHVGSDAHRFGGLGLGLAISRHLVELHFGQIRAHSAGRNEGSTFVIELPLGKTDKELLPIENGQVGKAVPWTGNNACILLVEDHEPTRLALTHLLTRRQYRVLTAGSTAEARDISAQEKIDLVISDIGLPDGNGNELMKDLRDRFGLKGIALTGYGMERDVEESRTSGFLTHLTKPVNVLSLEKALKEFIVS